MTNANRNDKDVKNDQAGGSRFKRTKVSERESGKRVNKREGERERRTARGRRVDDAGSIDM